MKDKTLYKVLVAVGMAVGVTLVGLFCFRALPGMGRAGTPEASAFDASFWPGLYSGAAYSVITGLVVGLIIWGVQLIADQRRMEATLERELSLFRERLRSILSQPDPLFIHADATGTEPVAQRVADLSAEHPIDLWEENLPHHEPALRLVRVTLDPGSVSEQAREQAIIRFAPLA
jgi:hypothetical protein